MTIPTTPNDLEAFYAEHADEMTPDERAHMANAVKVMRRLDRNPDAPVTSPRIISGYIESLLDCERDGSAFTSNGHAEFDSGDGPAWVDTVDLLDDYDQMSPTLRVACTDGNVYHVTIEEHLR